LSRKREVRPENELVGRALAGDETAFAALIALHQRPVRAFCRRLAGGSADGDDVAQSAFLTAWRRRSTYSGGSFKAWVCAIAFRDFLRLRRGAAITLDEEPHYDPEPAGRIDLMSALRRLPAGERAAVCLCVGEGFSHEEAAAILAAPLGTVKSWASRGRARLQVLLGDYDERRSENADEHSS